MTTKLPDELLREAERLNNEIGVPGHTPNVHVIAQALHQRDLRAAEIARSFPGMVPISPKHIRVLTGSDIAQAILSYDKEPPHE